MTPRDHAPDPAEREAQYRALDDAVRHLAQAIARLGNDPEYFIHALIEMLETIEPISRNRLTDNERRFLIESGSFTADELADAAASVDRGSLQLQSVEAWLVNLLATLSMDSVIDFLGRDEASVRRAVTDGNLYAVEISDQLRFPVWQFNFGSPSNLLPGLAEVIAVIVPRWDWRSSACFMATPQSDLFGEGRKTPAQWLREGGDVNDVQEIVEASDWS